MRKVRTSGLRLIVAGALILGFIAPASIANAQTLPSLDVRTWRPSTDPGAGLVLEPARAPGPFAWNVGAWLSYANRPVTLEESGPARVTYHPVENLVASDYVAELGLGKRAAVGVDLPVILYQEGSTGLPRSAVTSGAVPRTALGDLALTGKGTLLANDDGGFGLAVLGTVTLPTGDRESFMGAGSTSVSARVLADYSLVLATLQASVGYELLTQHHAWPEAQGGVNFGDAIPWSIGFLLRPGIVRALDRDNRQLWEVAFHGSLPAGAVGPFGSGDQGSQALSPALLALSDRIELGHYREAFVLVGADLGIASAVGVPTVRAVLAAGWAPRTHDKDKDRVPDDLDQCPEIAEDLDGFEDNDGCPELDDDEDGIPDWLDACPRDRGVPSANPAQNGCPAPVRVPLAPLRDAR